jgi:hypothetical protein
VIVARQRGGTWPRGKIHDDATAVPGMAAGPEAADN